MICLREPSLGPVFGMKGGATGGGYAQVVPMEDINLHFTGDFNAIALANNLLAALIDNHIHHGNELGIDVRRITWQRVVDMNDRALRDITVSLWAARATAIRARTASTSSWPRRSWRSCAWRPASPISRTGSAISWSATPATSSRSSPAILQAHGAMTVLLKDALKPNLVQTLENNPAFIHGGPFANIAHGCNSVLATRTALKLADYVVTEAGFGADLGAEKFIDIKCRKSGLRPAAAVIVATLRALKYHGGSHLRDVNKENLAVLEKGLANLERHVDNVRNHYGLPCVVAINHFSIRHRGGNRAAEVEDGRARRAGGPGARTGPTAARAPPSWRRRWSTSCDQQPIDHDVRVRGVTAAVGQDEGDRHQDLWRRATSPPTARCASRSDSCRMQGYGHYPVCVAKTQYSFSTDPAAVGAPSGHTVNIREVRLAAGAEFIVMICGDIMTMPGLPKVPSAVKIDIDDNGKVVGLS